MDAQTPADFKIARDGSWYHNGDPIKREALAKLFSDRALVVDENGDYWLKTPFEQYPVEVEDVPYVVIDYHGTDPLILKTNMDEEVSLDKKTRWELRAGIPYLEVRKGLFARIGRSVLYNLIETYGESVLVDGVAFPLGESETSE